MARRSGEDGCQVKDKNKTSSSISGIRLVERACKGSEAERPGSRRKTEIVPVLETTATIS